MDNGAKATSKKSTYQTVVDQIAGIFLPIINVLTASGILKSVMMLLVTFHILEETDGVYRVFYAVSDGFFYFLPFFLAVTAAEQWKLDKFVAMMIPVAMLYPDITAILENNGSFDFFQLTVPPTVFHSGVIPILLAVGLLYFVEKPCDKYLPSAIKGFMKPILCCLIVLPVTFLLFGRIGTWIGDALTNAFFHIYDWNAVVAGAFMGMIIQPMVVVGAHWSLIPIVLANIAALGYDNILPLLGGAVYGQAGAALAVGILYKHNKEKRRMAYQASFTAALGVTEPALFGVNVPLGRPMLAACMAGACGGAIAGFAGTHCLSFAFPSFITCVAYVGDGFALFLVSMIVCFPLGFLFTMLQKKTIIKRMETEDKEENQPEENQPEENALRETNNI